MKNETANNPLTANHIEKISPETVDLLRSINIYTLVDDAYGKTILDNILNITEIRSDVEAIIYIATDIECLNSLKRITKSVTSSYPPPRDETIRENYSSYFEETVIPPFNTALAKFGKGTVYLGALTILYNLFVVGHAQID